MYSEGHISKLHDMIFYDNFIMPSYDTYLIVDFFFLFHRVCNNMQCMCGWDTIDWRHRRVLWLLEMCSTYILFGFNATTWCAVDSSYLQFTTTYNSLLHRNLFERRSVCLLCQLPRVGSRSCNNFAQSNLGRGPHRGTVAHVRHKVSIGYNGAPPKCPFPWPDRLTLPHPWARPTYDAKWHPDPVRRFSTMH